MAFQLKHQDDELTEAHEINVTPFIDVMLVLLIVFMVAAPLATVDMNVDLPVSNSSQKERPEAPVFLTVKADLSLALGETVVIRNELSSALNKAMKGDKEQRIFLRADKTVDYGNLMSVMNDLRAAGYLKIALVGMDGVANL